MMQLSIIVPVYNVEKYVRPCIESIFKQGLDEDCFEVIIINDGTQDNSMEVIQDIIKVHHNIKVINQENQGLSITRNNGMEKATGEYVMFVDSDDLLIENSVPYLLDKAISSESDLVVADFIKMNDGNTEQFTQETFRQKDGSIERMTGKEMLMQKLQSGFNCVWKTLYRNNFLNKNDIRFIPHIYFEDIPFTYQCYAKANLCLKVNWLLYVYRVGHASIMTSSFNRKKGMDYSVCIAHTWIISKEESFSVQLRQKIQNDTFSYFSTLLYMLSSNGKLPHSEQMEVIGYLKKTAPDLSFKNGTKQKLVSIFYKRTPSAYMTFRTLFAHYLQDTFWKIKRVTKR